MPFSTYQNVSVTNSFVLCLISTNLDVYQLIYLVKR